jgi:hypothetical protein
VAVTVRPISDDDVPDVAAFLHTHLNQRVPAAAWVEAFDVPWAVDKPNNGFMLVDEEPGEIVGVYGAFYSDRVVDGRNERMCNLAAWCVREDQRFHSLRLLKAMLAQEGYTFTDLSPSGNVIPLNTRLGFEPLDTETVLVPNLPRMSRRRGVRISSDPSVLERTLTGDQLHLYRDHAGAAAARHLVLVDGGRWCYVVFRMDRRKKLPPVFASILHVSDRELFWRRLRPLGTHLLVRHRAVATLAERRVVGPGATGLSHRLKSPRQKMFLSRTLTADQIDYFYSELMLVSW